MVYRSGKLNVVADELSRCHAEVCDRVTPSLEEGGDVGFQDQASPHSHESEREKMMKNRKKKKMEDKATVYV